MSKKEQLSAVIIPENERDPSLEDRVSYYLQTTYTLPENKVKPQRTKPIITKDPIEKELWEREEIRRIREGHFGMSGKFYFFYNFCKIWDIESGMLRPEFRFVQNEFFKHIETQQQSKEWGVICVKRRRVGASWMVAADALHDCLTTPFFKVGMTSKTKEDAEDLFRKVKFLYDNLPEFLQYEITSSTIGSIEFAKKKAKIKYGLQSEIRVKAPTETSWEGFAIRKLVIDEAGKTPNVKGIYTMGNETMRVGTRRVGTPLVFGTSGDITKEGRDLMEMYYNADVYKLKPFFFAGYMGILVDEYGNDLKEHAIRWIVYERKRLESLSTKEYTAFIQQYPLTVQEAFKSSEEGGLGNKIKIEKQRHFLMGNPMPFKKGFFKPDVNENPIFVPDPRGQCIIYEEREDFKNLYLAGCLPPGEKVMTGDGLKSVENVNLQDKLINKEGEEVSINSLQKYQATNDRVFEVKIANTFRTTSFTSEHPIFVSTPIKKINDRREDNRQLVQYDFDFQFQKMEDVKVGDWVKVPNIYKKPNNFNIDSLWFDSKKAINSPDFWWLIGLYLGDGWLEHQNRIAFAISTKEQPTLDRLRRVVNELFSVNVNSRTRGGCFNASFGNQIFFDFLLTHFGKYSHGKQLPEWAKRIDRDKKAQLLLGYLDSDGCVYNQRGGYSIEYVSINLEMLEGFQDILLSLGVISGVSLLRNEKTTSGFKRATPLNTKKTYHLRIANGSSIKLANIIGDSPESVKLSKIERISDKRKVSKVNCFFDENEEYIYFKIMRINVRDYTGPVYNFDCETHTFMSHHIPTHNCDPTDHKSENKKLSSLSMVIMAKPNGLQPPKIIFKYTDRPVDPRDFYEQALMALKYYNNAKVLIERNKYGMISYFEEKGYKHLLAAEPQGVKKYVPKFSAQPGYYKTQYTTAYGEELIEQYVEDYWELIPAITLLDQLDNYGIQNTDEVDAFMACLMYLKDDKEKVKKAEEIKSNIPNFSYRYVNGQLVLVKNGSKTPQAR